MKNLQQQTKLGGVYRVFYAFQFIILHLVIVSSSRVLLSFLSFIISSCKLLEHYLVSLVRVVYNKNISMVSSMVSIVWRFMDNTNANDHTMFGSFNYTLP